MDHALLIGVSKLKNYPRSMHLKGPEHDVPAMKRLLIERFSFAAERVTTLEFEAASEQNIRSALINLGKVAAPGDRVFIYFSGHGIQVPDNTGNAGGFSPDGLNEAIVPFDMDPDTQQGLIRDHEIGRYLDQLQAREVIYIADACHSATGTRALPGIEKVVGRSLPPITPNRAGSAGRETGRAKHKKSTDSYHERLPPNLVFIAAAQADQLAEDLVGKRQSLTFDGKPHGNLTDAFIRAFQSGTSPNVTNRELRKMLVQTVTGRSAHEPSFETNAANLDRPFWRQNARLSSIRSRPRGPLKLGLPTTLRTPAISGQLESVANSKDFAVLDLSDAIDIAITYSNGRFTLSRANGRQITTEPSSSADRLPNKLMQHLSDLVMVHRFLDIGRGRGAISVSVDSAEGRYSYREGDELTFLCSASRRGSLLVLNLTEEATINVLIPNAQNRSSALASDKARIPVDEAFIVGPPFGHEEIKVFVFGNRPQFLDGLIPVKGEYMQMSARSAAGQALLKSLEELTSSTSDWGESSTSFESVERVQ